MANPHDKSIRGRGASANTPNRFHPIEYVFEDEDGEDSGPSPRTQFLPDRSKTVISTNDSPDIPFRVSFNPYRGCEHGCIYCYARPTHEYFGLSAGLDFETKIFVKEEAPRLLRETFLSKKWLPQSVAIAGVTDPYQPVERRLELTRRCLDVFRDFRNPVGIVTKNHLITRDIDILQELASFDAVSVMVSITTLDVKLNRILEPRTSLPRQRLDAIEKLTAAGIPAGVLMAPVIPGLNDSEIPAVLEAAANAGARCAGYTILRLPYAVAPLFEAWLEQHMPDRKAKILNRIRSMRDGKLNDPSFGSRMKGDGPYAKQIADLMRITKMRFGLTRAEFGGSTAAFRRPASDQLELFDETSASG